MANVNPFSFGADPGYGLPPAKTENVYAQETPAGPAQFALLPRPGLVSSFTVGAGPTRGKFSEPGVFSGDEFTVSATTLYRGTVSLGTIAGTGRVYFAASKEQLVIVGGNIAYCYNGTTLTAITDPDLLANPNCVAYLGGRFIYTFDDTDEFQWSAINDATDIDGLDFATAEGAPDPNLGVAVLGETLYFFGAKTVQPFYLTADLDAPFVPAQNRTFDQTGCAVFASVTALDNGLFFLGDDLIYYRVTDNGPQRISDHAVEAALAASGSITDLTALALSWDGHKFMVVNVPGQGSFAFDAAVAGKSPSAWVKWSTFDRTTFRCNCAVQVGASYSLGDDTTGEQFTLTTSDLDDDAKIVRHLSCFVPQAVNQPLGPIILRAAINLGIDVGEDAGAQMRLSRDLGNTFTDWRDCQLNEINYWLQPKWHRNGLARPPGTLFEFRVFKTPHKAWFGVSIGETA